MIKRNYGKWTKEKEDVLKELYPQTPNKEICERLGITMRALYSKAHLLGLKKKNGKAYRTLWCVQFESGYLRQFLIKELKLKLQ